MNKAELADALAERTGLARKDARHVVEALFDPERGLIAEALRRNERVALSGFGTFEARQRRARTARNPRTGETITVPASRSAAFRAGKGLKESLAAAPPA